MKEIDACDFTIDLLTIWTLIGSPSPTHPLPFLPDWKNIQIFFTFDIFDKNSKIVFFVNDLKQLNIERENYNWGNIPLFQYCNKAQINFHLKAFVIFTVVHDYFTSQVKTYNLWMQANSRFIFHKNINVNFIIYISNNV